MSKDGVEPSGMRSAPEDATVAGHSGNDEPDDKGADRHLGRKFGLIVSFALILGSITFIVGLYSESPKFGVFSGAVVTILAFVGPTVTLLREEIRRLHVPDSLSRIVGSLAVVLVVIAALMSIVPLLRPSMSDNSRPSFPSTPNTIPLLKESPPSSRADASLAIDHNCGQLDPTAWILPTFELCVVNWCQGIVTTSDGAAIDSSRVQIKLHPRIVNNSSTPLDISVARKPSPLRLLVASSDLPQSWKPPARTAAAGDRPYLIALQGQRYWAIAPVLPHDIDSVAGPVSGFTTFWDSTSIAPNAVYPPPVQRDAAGNAIEQQGDLVFQLPARTMSNNARYAGLALVSRTEPTRILAFADFKDWGPRLNPNQF